VLASLEKFLMDTEDPMVNKSRIETPSPHCALEKTEIAEAILETPRILNADPNRVESKTDIDDPARSAENSDKELPNREAALTEKTDPHRPASNKDILDPRTRLENTEIADPNLTEHLTDIELPIFK
jgi:hypothetical protein